MLFDIFARIVERKVQRLVPVLQEAKLFVFPYVPQEVLPKEYKEEEIEQYKELFHLPFPVLCVEDKVSLVFLMDTEENQIGLKGPWKYIDVMHVGSVRPETLPDSERKYFSYVQALPKDMVIVTEGSIREVVISKKISCISSFDKLWCFSKETGLLDVTSRMQNPLILESGAKNAMTAFQEVMVFNSPDRFVLEEVDIDRYADGKQRIRGSSKPAVLRRDERPRYTILFPHEIRKKLRLPESVSSGRASPRPHERRRHYRTYRDDRFVHMKGKTVVIPATWVGPSESVVGTKRYRVVLEV